MKLIYVLLFIFSSPIYGQNDLDFLRNSSFWDKYDIVTQPPLQDLSALEKCGEGEQQGRFLCVPYYNCNGKTNTIQQEAGEDLRIKVDVRFQAERQCPHYLDTCCQVPKDGVPIVNTPTPRPVTPVTRPITIGPVVTPPDDGVSERNPTLPTRGDFCGVRNTNGIDFQVTSDDNSEAEFGEFPWMVVVMEKSSSPELQLALCGGSLITPNVVLTAAHCVVNQKARNIKIRAGEWDSQTTKERIPHQEREVSDIIVHEAYAANALYNDAALLILSRPLSKAESIGTICLPEQQRQATDFTKCIATGWGKDRFGKEGVYAAILKKIELSTVDHEECQDALRTTRLGRYFELHKSFTCAGGEPGKDTCTGDGGGPLVCVDPRHPNRYVQVGIVSWGIGCGERGVPGVYADVTQFRSWVDQKLRNIDIDTSPYVLED